ncbi:MAG: hypothetical protein AAF153_02810, partial [Pseudomonadota bacterium]
MIFYQRNSPISNSSSVNRVDAVKQVARPAAILSGLNEQFTNLNQGFQFNARVVSHQAGETKLITQFGHITLMSNHNFNLEQEVKLTVTSTE